MRRRRREVLAMLAAIMGAAALSARADRATAAEAPAQRATLSIELAWTPPPTAEHVPALESPPQDVTIEMTDGRVVEAVSWPWDADVTNGGPSEHEAAAGGLWTLGAESSGRVRARIEAGPGAVLVVRRGAQAVRFPIASMLEGPQTAPQASGLGLTVQRLPWDVLAVDFGPGGDRGVATPGSAVSVSIGYDIIQPDSAEVTVRTTAVLRPIGKSDPIWQFEQREVLPANRPEPPVRLWSVPAPGEEGTYVLEVQAAWESTGVREGSRIGRLIRRRKPQGAVGMASRRVVMAVVAPQPPPAPADLLGAGENAPRQTEVDSFELTRIRNTRYSAFGRAPVAAGGSTWEAPAEVVSEASRREKEREWLRGFIGKAGAEPARLGAADASGLAWSAVSLRCPHPDKPHRLTATVPAGDASALGVMVIDAGSADRRPRVLLDACGSGAVDRKAPLEWILWPGSSEPILVLLNRSSTADLSIGTIRLVELGPPAVIADAPTTDAGSRALGIHLEGPDALERFVASAEPGLEDSLATAENLATYLLSCGAKFVVLPEGLEERLRRRRLFGGLVEDATGPDRLDMILRVLHRRGLSTWVEPDFSRPGTFSELPAPDSAEAVQKGLARIGPTGAADGGAYQPLHPRVRDAMKRRIVEALSDRDGRPGYSGVLVRLGEGPTLPGTPDTGMDDETYGRFVRETFGPDVARGIPGLDVKDPGRFKARADYLAGVGRMPWLAWRSKAVAALYAELAGAAHAAAPKSVLALATPTLGEGHSGDEARRVDLAGLAPSQAWRSLGLDLGEWAAMPDAPAVLRGAMLSDDGLARDLAAHPDLDSKVVGFPRRGFLLHSALDRTRRTRPAAFAVPQGEGVASLGPLAHAVSAFDSQWIVLSATAVSGREEGVRRFADVFRRLPAPAHRSVETAVGGKESGVLVRSVSDAGATFLEFVNDTPYAMRVAGVVKSDATALIEDLGRNIRLSPQPAEGGRRLVLDLAPFGLSVVRVSGTATLDGTSLYPPESVLALMEARAMDLTGQLANLNRMQASPIVEPPNAGFEQEPVTPVSTAAGDAQASAPGGWRIDRGGRGARLTIDEKNPNSGSRCLKLEAQQGPASVVSGEFSAGIGSTMLVQTYLRGDKDQAPVRIWIEGESGGKPFVRRSEAAVSSEWRPLIVRASDIPAGGLDSVRIRFEMPSPGSLWIDDVRVRSELAPKTVRLNAQRTLLAALQAYRERRYAEFARLADSHWTRHPGILSLVRGDRPVPPAEGPAKAAEASALPPDRTLR